MKKGVDVCVVSHISVIIPSELFKVMDLPAIRNNELSFMFSLGLPIFKENLTIDEITLIVNAKIEEISLIEKAVRITENLSLRPLNNVMLDYMESIMGIKFTEDIQDIKFEVAECQISKHELSNVKRVISVYDSLPMIVKKYSKLFKVEPRYVVASSILCYLNADKDLRVLSLFKKSTDLFSKLLTWKRMRTIFKYETQIPFIKSYINHLRSYLQAEEKQPVNVNDNLMDWVLEL